MNKSNSEHSTRITGHIVDVLGRKIYDATLSIEDGRVSHIEPVEGIKGDAPYIMPGFVDSHIHIESSMLLPRNFASVAIKHGSVAAICDPHEIANVLGIAGVKYVIEDGNKVRFHFFNGAPSCVPATCFETSGCEIDIEDTKLLLQQKEVTHLSEMMNFPGVLAGDSQVMQKIALAKKYGKPIDGHAPMLTGEEAQAYISAGISTDHECSTIAEAEEKIQHGMKILIREGSAAKNFEALLPLMGTHAESLMFCSDDKHPDDLLEGHINSLVVRAVAKGYDLFDVLCAASVNPIRHYNLGVGLLHQGDSADFILVDNLQNFNVLATYIEGIKVFDKSEGVLEGFSVQPLQDEKDLPNNFCTREIFSKDIQIQATSDRIKVIECFDGQLFTKKRVFAAKVKDGYFVSDTQRDILKIVVVNRYEPKPVQVGFIHGFGFKQGAIASSVAHDSHNIIAVGVSDKEILEALNKVIEHKGGIAYVSGNDSLILSLPIAGLMSDDKAEDVARQYSRINQLTTKASGKLSSPYMTLSFMALLVIPELKIGDRGLFDVGEFALTQIGH